MELNINTKLGVLPFIKLYTGGNDSCTFLDRGRTDATTCHHTEVNKAAACSPVTTNYQQTTETQPRDIVFSTNETNQPNLIRNVVSCKNVMTITKCLPINQIINWCVIHQLNHNVISFMSTPNVRISTKYQ